MAKIKNNGIIEVKIKAPKVKVDNRKNVSLVTVSISSLPDEEIKKIANVLSCENNEIRVRYFSHNTPIKETQQRRFGNLVRIFVERCKDHVIKISITSNAKVR